MFCDEIARMGADVRTDGHHAVVRGKDRLSSAPVRATDIRAGVGLVLAGLVADGVTEIAEVHHIDRGYVRIEEQLRALGRRRRADRVRHVRPLRPITARAALTTGAQQLTGPFGVDPKDQHVHAVRCACATSTTGFRRRRAWPGPPAPPLATDRRPRRRAGPDRASRWRRRAGPRPRGRDGLKIHRIRSASAPITTKAVSTAERSPVTQSVSPGARSGGCPDRGAHAVSSAQGCTRIEPGRGRAHPRSGRLGLPPVLSRLRQPTQASRLTAPATTGGSTDHGKLIQSSVYFQTYSQWTDERGFS